MHDRSSSRNLLTLVNDSLYLVGAMACLLTSCLWIRMVLEVEEQLWSCRGHSVCLGLEADIIKSLENEFNDM